MVDGPGTAGDRGVVRGRVPRYSNGTPGFVDGRRVRRGPGIMGGAMCVVRRAVSLRTGVAIGTAVRSSGLSSKQRTGLTGTALFSSSGTTTGTSQGPLNFGLLFTANQRNQWNQLRVHVKIGSFDNNDGVIQVWWNTAERTEAASTVKLRGNCP